MEKNNRDKKKKIGIEKRNREKEKNEKEGVIQYAKILPQKISKKISTKIKNISWDENSINKCKTITWEFKIKNNFTKIIPEK